jgi:hypothetical protein
MHSSTKRKTGNPAEPVNVVAVGVSKLNCEAVCGLTERQLYELGRAHKLPRLPGKIPVYRADALLALFSSEGGTAEADEANSEQFETAATVLARIGRRAAGAR